MKNSTKNSWTNTMCLLAGLGVAYSGALSASTEGVNCSITESNVWSSGFVVNSVEVTNNSGSAIDDWQVEIQLGSSQAAITNYWSSIVTLNEDIISAENSSYNGQLDDGESITFGFQGTYSGTWDEMSCIASGDPVVDESNSDDDDVESSDDAAVETSNDDDVESSNDDDVESSNDDAVETSDDAVVETSDDAVVETSNDDDVDSVTSGNLSCIEGNIDVWTDGVVLTDYGVQNDGDDSVSQWSMLLDFGTEITITDAWNGEPIASDNAVTISGTYLASNGQFTFGFQGTYSGDAINNPPICTVSATLSESTDSAATAYEIIQGDDWLHTDGSKIVDSNGHAVWLTGANWFGFNTGSDMFDGLWAANLESSIKEMTERGINILRIPISTELMADWMNGIYPVPGSLNASVNPELEGMNSLEIFDHTLAVSQKYGLKILMDAHSAASDASGHYEELWYDENVSAETFFEAWEWFAERYKNDDTILAFDLENEPHGQAYNNEDAALWDDSDDKNNWKAVAQALALRILAIHPDILILVEGVETTPIDGKTYASTDKDDYHSNWWGGNLRGVTEYPIELGEQQDKLVYSPHDYGPSVFLQDWFYDGFDMDSLYTDVWYDNWAYINEDEIAPLLIGEWGGYMDGGDNETWMLALRQFMIDNVIHHTFWCFNANSGDTGGLVENDFVTWDEEKYELLEKALWQTDEGLYISLDHVVPLGGDAGTGISVSDTY